MRTSRFPLGVTHDQRLFGNGTGIPRDCEIDIPLRPIFFKNGSLVCKWTGIHVALLELK